MSISASYTKRFELKISPATITEFIDYKVALKAVGDAPINIEALQSYGDALEKEAKEALEIKIRRWVGSIYLCGEYDANIEAASRVIVAKILNKLPDTGYELGYSLELTLKTGDINTNMSVDDIVDEAEVHLALW